MQAVHELGHVFAAMVSGGAVQAVVLHPLHLSRTDVHPNPHPVFVVWGGPLIGVLAPGIFALLWRALKLGRSHFVQFVAGFCLIANGLHLGLGTLEKTGDPGDLMRHGSPPWPMVAFAGICVPLGLWLWHRMSPHFGFGPNPRHLTRVDAAVAAGLLAAIASAEFLLNALV